MNDALSTFGAAISALNLELDWELLGRAACEGDGSDFYDAELREKIVDVGCQFADDIGNALGEMQGGGARDEPAGALGNTRSVLLGGPVADARGRSLYLGAEIAELPLILAEHLVMGRRVEWLNLASAHTSEITRAIQAVSAQLSVELPVPTSRTLSDIELASCDHLWMVSVLTDPDSFPALHDALYERKGSSLATGRGSLDDDRVRAEALVEALLDRAAECCVLSTTDEERTLIEPAVVRRGWELEFARGGRLTAIVGDCVRIGTLRANRVGHDRS